MTATTEAPATPASAVTQYLAELVARENGALIRTAVTHVYDQAIDAMVAARVLTAAGVSMTGDDLDRAAQQQWAAEHPAAQVDNLEYDHGPIQGSRTDAETVAAAVAQQDLDDWITGVAGRSRCTAPWLVRDILDALAVDAP